MIKIENVDTFGWEAAIRGMRNPMNSWNKSDSGVAYKCGECGVIDRDDICNTKEHDCSGYLFYDIGPNDFDLMKRLAKAGPEHAKYLRMVNVTMDITAPLYWWKEFDTYKVGTVANSCSTMHKIHAKEFERDDFSYENLFDFMMGDIEFLPIEVLDITISCLNECRKRYLETKDKDYWWQMIQLLPTSYNQRRTVQLNYQVLSSMYKQRKNHKLDEWRTFCEWIDMLPYSGLITGNYKEEL